MSSYIETQHVDKAWPIEMVKDGSKAMADRESRSRLNETKKVKGAFGLREAGRLPKSTLRGNEDRIRKEKGGRVQHQCKRRSFACQKLTLPKLSHIL